MRILLALCLAACAHHPPPSPVAVRTPAPAPTIVPVAPDDDALLKLPDYKPMQSFLEKTSPKLGSADVYISLTPTEAPMSLERRLIETAAQSCFLQLDSREDHTTELTMTLETRDDGTVDDASIDHTTVSLGSCLIQRLVKVRLHEEGKRQHMVIVVSATVTAHS